MKFSVEGGKSFVVSPKRSFSNKLITFFGSEFFSVCSLQSTSLPNFSALKSSIVISLGHLPHILVVSHFPSLAK